MAHGIIRSGRQISAASRVQLQAAIDHLRKGIEYTEASIDILQSVLDASEQQQQQSAALHQWRAHASLH
jgi:hypothetical protein